MHSGMNKTRMKWIRIHLDTVGSTIDQETGNTYLRNRYYNGSVGRFITEDPIRDGLNWYAYASNNPVLFLDPFGLSYIAGVWYDDYNYYMNDGTDYMSIVYQEAFGNDSGTLGYHVWDKDGNEYTIYDSNIQSVGVCYEDGSFKLVSGEMWRQYGFSAFWDQYYQYDESNDSVTDEGWMIYAAAVGIATGIRGGAAAKKAASSLAPVAPAIGEISQRTQEHIMNSKHAWDKVVSDPNNWAEVNAVITNVLQYGTESPYGSVLQKTLQIKDETVVVTYKIIDDIIRISDGWVKTK